MRHMHEHSLDVEMTQLILTMFHTPGCMKLLQLIITPVRKNTENIGWNVLVILLEGWYALNRYLLNVTYSLFMI